MGLLQPPIHEGHEGIQRGGRVRNQREAVAVGFYLYGQRHFLTRFMSVVLRQEPLHSLAR